MIFSTVGTFGVNQTSISMQEVEREVLEQGKLLPGGTHIPEDCTPPKSVAIIIPFRCKCLQDYHSITYYTLSGVASSV